MNRCTDLPIMLSLVLACIGCGPRAKSTESVPSPGIEVLEMVPIEKIEILSCTPLKYPPGYKPDPNDHSILEAQFEINELGEPVSVVLYQRHPSLNNALMDHLKSFRFAPYPSEGKAKSVRCIFKRSFHKPLP